MCNSVFVCVCVKLSWCAVFDFGNELFQCYLLRWWQLQFKKESTQMKMGNQLSNEWFKQHTIEPAKIEICTKRNYLSEHIYILHFLCCCEIVAATAQVLLHCSQDIRQHPFTDQMCNIELKFAAALNAAATANATKLRLSQPNYRATFICGY